jgi:hypothetical protein
VLKMKSYVMEYYIEKAEDLDVVRSLSVRLSLERGSYYWAIKERERENT